MTIGLLALLAAMTGLQSGETFHHAAPFKLLVIELPDGERGGTGRIQGAGVRHPNWRYPFSYTDLARGCGAHYPMFSNNTSHSEEIISWSAANNREVVKCLKAKLPSDFNAGIAQPTLTGGFTRPIDTSPFRYLETAPELARKKPN